MWQVLGRLSGLLTGEAQKKRRQQRKRRNEESRAASAHAGRAARVPRRRHGRSSRGGRDSSAPPPAARRPAPAPTLVTLDASHNLVVRDVSAAGQNDNLTIRFDASRGGFQISDPDHLVATDIAGASGSGSHSVFVPAHWSAAINSSCKPARATTG